MSELPIDIPPPPAALFEALEKNRHGHNDLLAMLCSTAAPVAARAPAPEVPAAPEVASAPPPPIAGAPTPDEIAAFEAAAYMLTPEHLRIPDESAPPAQAPPQAEPERPATPPATPPPFESRLPDDTFNRAARDMWAALGDALGTTSAPVAHEPPIDIDASELFYVRPTEDDAPRKRTSAGPRSRRSLLASCLPHLKPISLACAAVSLIAIVGVASGGSAEDVARAAPARSAHASQTPHASKAAPAVAVLSHAVAAPPAKAAKPRRR